MTRTLVRARFSARDDHRAHRGVQQTGRVDRPVRRGPIGRRPHDAAQRARGAGGGTGGTIKIGAASP